MKVQNNSYKGVSFVDCAWTRDLKRWKLTPGCLMITVMGRSWKTSGFVFAQESPTIATFSFQGWMKLTTNLTKAISFTSWKVLLTWALTSVLVDLISNFFTYKDIYQSVGYVLGKALISGGGQKSKVINLAAKETSICKGIDKEFVSFPWYINRRILTGRLFVWQ